jgi:RNA polymerase sigma factor (sigma-70 family)
MQLTGGHGVAEAPEGDEFEAVYRQLYPFVARTAYLIVLDWESASDIAQEAFGRLWRHRHQVDASANRKAWLLRVAVNLAIDKKRGILAAIRQRLAVQPEADPGDIAVTRLEIQAMREALLRLLPRDRALLALRFEQGLSFPEIGELLGRPEATAKTWVHRALGELRRELGGAPDSIQMAEGNP